MFDDETIRMNDIISVKHGVADHEDDKPETKVSHGHARQFLNGRLLLTCKTRVEFINIKKAP